MAKRPGGELATRPLHFIWIADCSGSMAVDGKIQALNTAIREALPHMRQVADENPNAEVLVRALKFSTGAQWHVSQPTPVTDFKWADLQTEGVTDLGRALAMVAEQLRIPPMSDRALPPALILAATDGYANAYRDEASFRQVAGDFWTLLRDEGAAAVQPHLSEWLNEASQQGSGDDISVGLVWRPPDRLGAKGG